MLMVLGLDRESFLLGDNCRPFVVHRFLSITVDQFSWRGSPELTIVQVEPSNKVTFEVHRGAIKGIDRTHLAKFRMERVSKVFTIIDPVPKKMCLSNLLAAQQVPIFLRREFLTQVSMNCLKPDVPTLVNWKNTVLQERTSRATARRRRNRRDKPPRYHRYTGALGPYRKACARNSHDRARRKRI